MESVLHVKRGVQYAFHLESVEEGEIMYRLDQVDSRTKEPAFDWTVDETGSSNSSEAFQEIVQAVQSLISGSAHDLIHGRHETVARLIVAQLAHRHHLTLLNTNSPTIVYALSPREERASGCPYCGILPETRNGFSKKRSSVVYCGNCKRDYLVLDEGEEYFSNLGWGHSECPGCIICGGPLALYYSFTGITRSREAAERIVRMFDRGATIVTFEQSDDRAGVRVGTCDKYGHKMKLAQIIELVHLHDDHISPDIIRQIMDHNTES